MATKNQLRGHSKVEINMKVESLAFKKDSEITDSGRTYYSGNEYYGTLNPPKIAYATLEKNYWNLDGSKKLLPQNNFETQPIIFNDISNENCEFENEMSITISAIGTGLEYNIIGIKFVFDEIDKDFATKFKVECYKNDELIKTVNWENDSVECKFTDGLDGFNKLKIVFLKMNKPNRRLRITEMFLGLEHRYTNKEIIQCKQKWTLDILSREITDSTFDFTIDNSDLNYNVDNPNSINKYFQEKQILQVKYYYEIGKDVYESIKGGKMYLTGTPTTEDFEATFEAKGSLHFMSDIYSKGEYIDVGQNYYDLLVKIFKECNVTEYSVDESLKTINTKIPLSLLAAKEQIQLICNATNMICYEDRDGYIRIKPNDETLKEYYLDLKNQIEYPLTETIPKLRNINVIVHQPSVSKNSQEIYNGSFNAETTKTLKINYSTAPATDCSTTLTNATLNGARYYANYCELDVTTTDATKAVGVIITGKPIEINESTYTLNVNIDGEDCNIDNPLIDSEERAESVALQFKKYLTQRNTYETENRGEPIWDVDDIIKLQTQFSDMVYGIITSNEVEFDGTLSGKTIFKGISIE